MDARFSQTTDRRQTTLRRMMRAFFEEGSQSCAVLARNTGLSMRAVADAIEWLQKAGLIERNETSKRRVERSTVNYRVNGAAAAALAMDVGGTKIEATVIDLSGNIVAQTRCPTDQRGGHHVTAQLADIGFELLKAAGISRDRLMVCVAGVPGVPDPSTGSVKLASNIWGWGDMNVSEQLAARLGCVVHLENDVNLAALGESYFGGGQNLSNFGFLNIGTGIGMGLMLEKTLIKGPTGAAGEIGFLPIGTSCGYYSSAPEGQLEQAIGSSGLLIRYNGGADSQVDSIAEVFERARHGEARANMVVNDAASAIATAILCVVAILDIRTIVLGGSIGMQDVLVRRIDQSLKTQGAIDIDVTVSSLPNTAGTLGALHLAFRQLADSICHFDAASEPHPNYRTEFASALTTLSGGTA